MDNIIIDKLNKVMRHKAKLENLGSKRDLINNSMFETSGSKFNYT